MHVRRMWALVADGNRARIVRGVGSKSEDAPAGELTLHFDKKRLGEIMADKPGRAFSSVGGRRSAMEYASDPVREEGLHFAQEIAALLGRHLKAGEFDALLVYAAPRMLGFLRDAIPEALKSVIVSESDKDLTKLPEAELRALVTQEAKAHPVPVQPAP